MGSGRARNEGRREPPPGDSGRISLWRLGRRRGHSAWCHFGVRRGPRRYRVGAAEPTRPLTGTKSDQFTNSLSVFNAAMRTFLLAGFALNIIFSPLNGLTPSRAFVAGFFTTFIFKRPGSVNKP